MPPILAHSPHHALHHHLTLAALPIIPPYPVIPRSHHLGHHAHATHLASVSAGLSCSFLGFDDSGGGTLQLEILDLNRHRRVFQLDQQVLDMILVDQDGHLNGEYSVLLIVAHALT